MRHFSTFAERMIASSRRSLMFFSLLFVFFIVGHASYGQRELRNPVVTIGELIRVIPSLKDYKIPASYVPVITRIKDRVVGLNEDEEETDRKQYSTRIEADPVVQRFAAGLQSPNPTPTAPSVITQNFDGMGYTNVAPADPSMCAGPNHIIQMINGGAGALVKVWDRNGTQVLAQVSMSALVAGSGYSGSGDPVPLYDQFADRFMLTEFGHAGAGSGINSLIVFVSQTNNPTGGWFVYKFTDNTFFPDYPHWGIWPNVLYASTNDFNTAGTAYLGSSVYAMNKTKMIAGDVTAELQRFRLQFNCAPVNISGPTAPSNTGTVGHFMYYNDNDFNPTPGAADSIGLMNFTPNFAVPASTTLTFAQALVTAPFKSGVCGGRNCVPSASGNGYDALSDRIMNRVFYRSFAGYEALVLNYTVDANAGIGSPKAGIRWYELRKTGGAWSIFQQSTYAPDNDWRWMGSININSKGQIALGFNKSGPTSYASVLFTGRNAGDAANTMSVQEQVIKAGTNYGTFGNRWGDYNDLATDVVNDSLFWMTAMYGNTASAWATRIAQFKIGDCDVLSSSFNFTQNAPAVPESQNIIYTNTVNNTGCVPMTNFLLTDTLPNNVTFVSATNGGTYNAGNRVVSWPVNINAGLSQTYSFTVNINAGSYFAPITLLNEPVAGASIPAGWTATTATGPTNWVSSAAQSHSAPNSLFGADNATAITDFRVSMTSPLALGAPTSKLTFWHNYNTESGWDGGVVEISTNGGTTWNDLGSLMTINGYNNSVGGTNPIAGRPAFSGNSGGWIQTSVNLLPYANQNALFRFRMTSDDNTAATGWYVDDINISSIAQVNMRTSLFDGAGVRQSFKDTVTLILPPSSGCTPPQVTTQPSNVQVCATTNASFTIAATIGTTPFTYQWQESTNGGGSWANVTNGGIYGGATTVTLNLTGVTAGMNNYQYRCIVTGQCAPNATSNAAVLSVVTLSVGGTVTPANTSVCGTTNSGLLTLSGFTGNIIRWESSINSGGTWTPIANTLNTYTFTNITQTTWYRAVVQATGCAAANSSVAIVTFNAALPMFIIADPGTTLCAGDPTRLTVMESSGVVPASITQSSSLTITPGNSVSCNNGIGHTDNSYYRSYQLAFPAAFTINTVTFGIEQASGGPQPVTVNLYTNTGGAFPNGTLTLVGTQAASVPNQSGTLFNVNFATPVTVAGNANLVIELFTPDGQATGHLLFVGSNTAAQTGPSYIKAALCGVTNPVDLASLGFPNDHIILNASGTTPGSLTQVNTGTFLWSPAAGLSSTTTNPVAASPAVTTTYTVNNNNGAGCIRQANITITVNQRPAVTAQPANVSLCSGSSASFTVAATGTGISYQWQESTNGGTTYNNITNGGIYSGATTTTLTVNPVSFAMNGYRYRCAISGTCPPVANSNGAILTVVALPNVTVTPTASCGGVAGINGTLLTASGASTYTWAPLAGLYTDPTASTAYTGTQTATVYAAPTTFTAYTVTGTNSATGCSNTATALINYTPPAPTVTPNPVAMCLGDAAVRLVSSSATSTNLTFNSGTIAVVVPDATPSGAVSTITASGVPANGTVSAIKVTWNMSHTWDGDMVFALKAPNGQILNLDYYLSTTGGTGATTGFVNTAVSSAGTNSLSSGSGTYTGTFKADAVITNAFGGAGGPTGYTPTTTSWNPLFATGAAANGVYTLAMKDGFAGDQGTLTSWKLDLTYVVGVPSTPATWSPSGVGSGLFNDPAATIAYTGTPQDTVYTRPTPSGVYNYNVTVQSLPPTPITVNTPMAGGNGNQMILFNLQNTNSTAYTLKAISTNVFTSGTATVVNLYYKTSPIAGAPGLINAGNGWNLAPGGTASNVAVTANNLNQVLSNLNLSLPAGATYGIALEFTAGTFPAYTNGTGVVQTYGSNGINIITDGNVGWGSGVAPGPPGNNPRNFNGSVTMAISVPACTSPARVVTVTVNTPISITTQPVNATVCTDKTASFSITATGTSPVYQWQVSTDAGTTFTNITNGGVYSGATTSTLTITAPPTSMNGYIYRCAVAGAAPCATAFSANRLLTVNPLPTVVINASPYRSLLPGLRTTLFSTSSPAAATYTWLRNGSVVAGATASSLLVDIDGQGRYKLTVTDVNGCTNTSNEVLISDSTSGRVFIYPSPNSGQFQVRYNPVHNNVTPYGINIYDALGKRILTQNYTLGIPFAKMKVDLSNYSTGVYWVEVVDVNGDRLAIGRVEVIR